MSYDLEKLKEIARQLENVCVCFSHKKEFKKFVLSDELLNTLCENRLGLIFPSEYEEFIYNGTYYGYNLLHHVKTINVESFDTHISKDKSKRLTRYPVSFPVLIDKPYSTDKSFSIRVNDEGKQLKCDRFFKHHYSETFENTANGRYGSIKFELTTNGDFLMNVPSIKIPIKNQCSGAVFYRPNVNSFDEFTSAAIAKTEKEFMSIEYAPIIKSLCYFEKEPMQEEPMLQLTCETCNKQYEKPAFLQEELKRKYNLTARANLRFCDDCRQQFYNKLLNKATEDGTMNEVLTTLCKT